MGDRDHENPSLIQRAQVGDPEAIARLWRQLNPALLRYLRGRLPAGAGKVAARTWLDAARVLPAVDGDDAVFRRHLFTIARGHVIDTLDQSPTGRLKRRAAKLGRGLPVDQRDELGRALTRIRRLPADEADAFLLRVAGDLEIHDIALVTGHTEQAVRTEIRRAMQRLEHGLR